MRADIRAAATSMLAIALPFFGSEAQTHFPELRHIRWPLLDIVVVPDSAGLWFIAGPNPWTTQWESGSHLVDFSIDPVAALQWAHLARTLAAATGAHPKNHPGALTPPLRARRGPELVMLGTNPKSRSEETRFVLVVS